jgi:hypothetical protein
MEILSNPEMMAIFAGLLVQTIVIARVNKAQIDNIHQHITDVKNTAAWAHRRIDATLTMKKS